MSNLNDDHTCSGPQRNNEAITNLTIRDFFAAAALVGEMSAMTQKEKDALKEVAGMGVDISAMAAENSYLYADSMLEARKLSSSEIVNKKTFPTQNEADFWSAVKNLGLFRKS